MSSKSPLLLPMADGERRHGHSNLAVGLSEIGIFLRRMRAQARVGDLSRACLQLLRFEITAITAQCDWIARPPDVWDADLRPEIGVRNLSLQALKDAIDVRCLLFALMPEAVYADLRVYRELPDRRRELVIFGRVNRHEESQDSARSVAMRAKLLGFCFVLENEVLCGIDAAEPREVAA